MAEQRDHLQIVPSWNGNPETWQTYKEEVRIWLLGSKLDVEFSLAAWFVAQLKGPARRLGLAMTDDELSAKRSEPVDLKKGVVNLMPKLETLASLAEWFRLQFSKRGV